MSEQQSVSRRAALAGLGAGGLGVALGSRLAGASAGEQAGPLADHPLAGIWMAMVTLPSAPDVAVAVPSIYGADGFVLLAFPPSQVGPNGVQFKSVSLVPGKRLTSAVGTSRLSNRLPTSMATISAQ